MPSSAPVPHDRGARASGPAALLRCVDDEGIINARSIGGMTGKAPKQYGSGRVCACGAKMSTYTSGKWCNTRADNPERRRRFENGEPPMLGSNRWKSRAYPDGCRLCPDGEKLKRRHAAHGVCAKHYNTEAYHELLAADAREKEDAAAAVEAQARELSVGESNAQFMEQVRTTEYVHGKHCGFQPGPGATRGQCSCNVRNIDLAWDLEGAPGDAESWAPLGVHIGNVTPAEPEVSDEAVEQLEDEAEQFDIAKHCRIAECEDPEGCTAGRGCRVLPPYDQDADVAKEAEPRCRATARHPSHDAGLDNLSCELPYVHRGPHHSGQWVWEDTMADAILDRDGNELSEERGVEPGAEPKLAEDGAAAKASIEQQIELDRAPLKSALKELSAGGSATRGSEWLQSDLVSIADPEVIAIERVHDALAMLDSQSARARVVSWAMSRFELSFGG